MKTKSLLILTFLLFCLSLVGCTSYEKALEQLDNLKEATQESKDGLTISSEYLSCEKINEEQINYYYLAADGTEFAVKRKISPLSIDGSIYGYRISTLHDYIDNKLEIVKENISNKNDILFEYSFKKNNLYITLNDMNKFYDLIDFVYEILNENRFYINYDKSLYAHNLPTICIVIDDGYLIEPFVDYENCIKFYIDNTTITKDEIYNRILESVLKTSFSKYVTDEMLDKYTPNTYHNVFLNHYPLETKVTYNKEIQDYELEIRDFERESDIIYSELSITELFDLLQIKYKYINNFLNYELNGDTYKFKTNLLDTKMYLYKNNKKIKTFKVEYCGTSTKKIKLSLTADDLDLLLNTTHVFDKENNNLYFYTK